MNAFRLPTAAAPMLLALCGSALAEDYPTTAAPVTQPVYRCANGTYTHVPCTGGVQISGPRVAKTFDKNALPPQDRARKMARAVLPPETRDKCADLESHIRGGEARLRSKSSAPTEQEEGDLAILRVQYRELRC